MHDFCCFLKLIKKNSDYRGFFVFFEDSHKFVFFKVTFNQNRVLSRHVFIDVNQK